MRPASYRNLCFAAAASITLQAMSSFATMRPLQGMRPGIERPAFFITTGERYDRMSVRDLYNAAALNYDSIVSDSRYVGPLWLERMLQSVPRPEKAVDFACANGALGRVLRKHYAQAKIIGVDISDSMVKEARGTGLYAEVHRHDLNAPLPSIPDGCAQLAVALGFAEFLHRPDSFLTEAARILAPAGTLLMSFQEYRPDQPSLAPRQSMSGDVSYRAYSVDEIRSLFLSSAFALRSAEPITGYVTRSGFACPYVMVCATRKAH